MTDFIQFSSVDQKHLYFWVLRCYLQKNIRQNLNMSVRWTLKSYNTISVVKGPFAHKKSKEQFTLTAYTARVILRYPIFLGHLIRLNASSASLQKLQLEKLYGACTRVTQVSFLLHRIFI